MVDESLTVELNCCGCILRRRISCFLECLRTHPPEQPHPQHQQGAPEHCLGCTSGSLSIHAVRWADLQLDRSPSAMTAVRS